MSTDPPIAEVVLLLESAGLDYMLVGSHASTLHGAPRTTHDLDVVVELDTETLERLLPLIDRDRFYVPESSARDAVANDDMFNLVDLVTGWKVDVIVRHDRVFSEVEFARRQPAVMGGVEIFVASPEDTVLSKLVWAAESGSDRQITDAAGVLGVNRGTLDDAYLDHWAAELGVVDLLRRARDQAGANP